MLLNQTNLTSLNTGFKALFNEGLGMAPDQWSQVAQLVPSDGPDEKYGWLKEIPGLRKWLGDRVVHSLSLGDYAITNQDYEDTVAVDTNAIDDDKIGVLAPRFRMMGRAVAAFPNQLVYDLLKAGFSTVCYDGQYFFDTDHPVLDATGTAQSVANTDGGSGAPWFLIATGGLVKPLLYQLRKAGQFEQLTPMEWVKRGRQIEYGVHIRANVGFGFWQVAWGSKQTLDASHYATARAAIAGMKGDHGQPLGLVPDLLVYPPALEGSALEIVNAERDAAGATNVWRGTARPLMTPWLA
jgi:phage major head subunit gpT-like protein